MFCSSFSDINSLRVAQQPVGSSRVPGHAGLVYLTLIVIFSQLSASTCESSQIYFLICLFLSYLLFIEINYRTGTLPWALVRAAVFGSALSSLAVARLLLVLPDGETLKALANVYEKLRLESNQSVQSGRGGFGKRGAAMSFVGTVAEAPRRKREGEVIIVVRGVVERGVPGLIQLKAGDLPWNEGAKVNRGDKVEGTAALTPTGYLKGTTVHPFSYDAFLLRRGILASGKVLNLRIVDSMSAPLTLRAELTTKLFRAFGESDALTVLIASALGNGDAMSESLWNVFRKTGTAHLVVVSGFHIGLMFFLAFSLTKSAIKHYPMLIVACPAQIPAALVGLVASCFYTIFTGGDITAVRSLFVVALYALGQIVDRTPEILRTTLVALILVPIIWPGALFEPSSQLTFCAIFGLLTFERFVSSCRSGFWSGRILKPFLLSVGASLYTLPAVLGWFSMFTPLAPIINFLVIPIFSLLFISGGLASIALWHLHCPFADLILRFDLWLGTKVLELLESAHLWCENHQLGSRTLASETAVIAALVILPILVTVSLSAFSLERAGEKNSSNRRLT